MHSFIKFADKSLYRYVQGYQTDLEGTDRVLLWVGFDAANAVQAQHTEFGITSLVTIIPMTLMIIAAFVISRYELTDKRMNEINEVIESR